MLIVSGILGAATEPRFHGRVLDRLWIAAADAGRRRLRARTEGGLDVAVDLARRDWLAEGAVLDDDGARIVVVARTPEPLMIVDLPRGDARAALRVGHALGNRHAPVVLRDGGLVTPVTDTPELAARAVRALGLPGVAIRFVDGPFAPDAPPDCAGVAHD
jgi:urease accessory protein